MLFTCHSKLREAIFRQPPDCPVLFWLDAFTFIEFRVSINKSTHAIDRKIFSEYFYDVKLCRVRLIYPSVIEDYHRWMVSEGRVVFVPCDIIIEKVLCTKLFSKSNYHVELRGLHKMVKTFGHGFYVCIIELPELTWNMPWSLLKNHSVRHSVKPNWMPRGQGIPVKFIDCLPLTFIEGLFSLLAQHIFVYESLKKSESCPDLQDFQKLSSKQEPSTFRETAFSLNIRPCTQ